MKSTWMIGLVWMTCLPLTLSTVEVDKHGYILYCPCMGRFGNQADHFLGALAFAKALDRLLVLPPWVEYHYPNPKSVQVPFDTYFQVSPLAAYHRVMTMEQFMQDLAPTLWPPGQRTVMCYQARTYGPKPNDCNAKDGNPFGPFWDTFNVDFDKSEFFAPLLWEVQNFKERQRWEEKYPPEKFPVLAFTGAPASFPVQEQNRGLHRYLKWSDQINMQADTYIQEKLERPFVGIHLRVGSDFKNACEHFDESPHMFAAAQCFGYRGEKGTPQYEMCYPSEKTIIKEVKQKVEAIKAKSVFIATDSTDMIDILSKNIKQVNFVKGFPDNPHLDLAILGRSDHFIGNCVSTFTAFVKRERDVTERPSSFWAFTPSVKEEL